MIELERWLVTPLGVALGATLLRVWWPKGRVKETVLYYETESPDYHIRIWVETTMMDQKEALFSEIEKLKTYNPRFLADTLAEGFPDFVNAVEVRAPGGQAELTYNDWP